MEFDGDSSSDQGNLLEVFVNERNVGGAPDQQEDSPPSKQKLTKQNQKAQLKSLNLKKTKASILADSKQKLRR